MSNRMESYQGTSPSGSTDTMCKITVDSLPCTLRLTDCIAGTGDHTLQLWVRSESTSSVEVYTNEIDDTIETSNYWGTYVKSFTANQAGSVNIKFTEVGVYYLYHVKLETGSTASQWTSYGDEAQVAKYVIFGTVESDMSALVINGSDEEIGFIYEIHCNGEVVNPVIHHVESNTHFKINGRFKLNDTIIIDSRRGKKSLVKTYRGESTNIINNLDNSSKWLELQSGYNNLIQSADSGTEYMDSKIIYTNEYEGV